MDFTDEHNQIEIGQTSDSRQILGGQLLIVTHRHNAAIRKQPINAAEQAMKKSFIGRAPYLQLGRPGEEPLYIGRRST